MIHKRRNDEALATMQAANPFSATALREAIGDAELSRAMQRAIANGESPSQPVPAGDRVAIEHGLPTHSGRRGLFARHRGASLAVGTVCALVVAALILLSGGSVDSVRKGGHPTFAAAAVEVAEANPRLLVTKPGWSIIHARGFEVDGGELIYKDADYPAYGPGGHQLELDWYPASEYRQMLRDRHDASAPLTSTLLGHRATTFYYAGQRPAYATILAPEGKVFIEVSGVLGSKREYEAVLHSLRQVGVDAWLAAMPPEVVRPSARAAVVEQMLRGIPVPPGFDASTLQSETALNDRFMLAKALTGAVACGWLARWQSAVHSGNDATVREAVDAMATATHWPVLLQMVRERGYEGDTLPPHGSGWPSEVLTAAREIAAGHLRRRPAVKTFYVHGQPAGYMTPAGAAPASVMECDL
jgi:hypothetical protein